MSSISLICSENFHHAGAAPSLCRFSARTPGAGGCGQDPGFPLPKSRTRTVRRAVRPGHLSLPQTSVTRRRPVRRARRQDGDNRLPADGVFGRRL